MAYDADALIDRQRLKRRLFIWRSLAILALVGVVAAAVGRVGSVYRSDYIARIAVTGVIFDDAWRRKAIERVGKDSRAKALIVHVDSPGGTVVGGETLFKSLRRIARKKPVVAVMGQVATSAGYMVALAADRIVAREGTITGSIGVVLQTTEITGLLEKLGISAEAIKSGPLKAAPSPFERMTPEVRKATQELVDDIHRMFVDMVAKRRKMTVQKVRALADGRVFTGRIALARKLIDGIGGETEAVAWLEKSKKIESDLPVRTVRIEQDVGDWLGFVDSLARKTLFSERLKLDGLVSVWHPALR